MQNIKVRAVNRQTIGHESDTIEESGFGSIYEKNGKHYIMYSVDNDGGTDKVTVIADRDSVRIKRSGSVCSDMLYSMKHDTVFKYHTPYGAIDMRIKTISIHNGLNESGGKLRLIYTLMMQGTETYNDMKIIIG